MKYLFLILVTFSSVIHAKHYEVKLLTSDASGKMMLMSPGYLKIFQGDTVTFIPSDPSHNVESVSIPEQASAFASPMGQTFSYTFSNKGVYLYKCSPHFALGMLGVIQVGEAENRLKVEQDWQKISSGVVMNKERINGYLSQAK
ncbi:plastocyanin/azurin family copper-binding protein [Pseudocolwellia sp. HL-MZ7]|uniref:plastocyanin/azurin family copper-binding protein n=1 Tax=Pseudocolwellia sp. HL-MZ7 TaxID=3400627 RepID=UPI003CEE4BE1